MRIASIEGVGQVHTKTLSLAGIKSTQALLKVAATAKGRKELEEKTKIAHKQLLDWVNRADLMRIKGIGEEYSDLLEKAGVDTVVELATRNADNLLEKVIEINKGKKLVRKLPALSMIADWIKQAKKLPRIVEY
jgi:predicted flap endonuclease-1-like 5' DNA nuclease